MRIVTAVGATPNRVQVIYEFLARGPEAGIDRDRLAALIAPASLARKENAGEDNAFSDCIGAGTELGLFRREEDRILISGERTPNIAPAEEFVVRVRRALLSPDVSTLTPEGSFAGSVAWMLCQDPHVGLGAKDAQGPIAMFREQVGQDGPDYDLGSTATYQQAVYWARYLGFVSKLKVKENTLVIPDPTQAILAQLDAVLPRAVEKPMVTFLADLAKVCPVLEGALGRTEVESRLPPRLQRESRVVSRSTALALSRLRKRGILAFSKLDDGQIVSCEGLQDDGRVTHVRRTEVLP